MNDIARPRSIDARRGVRTAPVPAGRPRPQDPLHTGITPDDRHRTHFGFERWSPALTLGLALASPQTALLAARLLGPRVRRGPAA